MQLGTLGTGASGTVELMRHSDSGEVVAVRFIERGQQVVHDLRRPSTAQPPHIVPVSRLRRYSLARRRPFEHELLARIEHCAYHALVLASQVTKHVEREVLNHRSLLHPHVLQFREVWGAVPTPQLLCTARSCSRQLRCSAQLLQRLETPRLSR